MASTDGCSAIQLTGMKSLQSLYEARLMEAISLLVAQSRRAKIWELFLVSLEN